MPISKRTRAESPSSGSAPGSFVDRGSSLGTFGAAAAAVASTAATPATSSTSALGKESVFVENGAVFGRVDEGVGGSTTTSFGERLRAARDEEEETRSEEDKKSKLDLQEQECTCFFSLSLSLVFLPFLVFFFGCGLLLIMGDVC